MYKPFLFLLFVFCGTMLSAQELKPMPDCAEMKDKISTIVASFDKLLKTFKKEQTKKEAHRNVYSSDFEICGEKGRLVEDTATVMENNERVCRYMLTFRFTFAKRDYKAPPGAFPAWAEKTFKILREVFKNWKYEFESESNGAMTYHAFYDKANDSSIIKKEVDLDIYDLYDGFSFNLIFQVSNY